MRKDCGFARFRPPFHSLHKDACAIHDDDYVLGKGTKHDRHNADLIFLINMLKGAKQETGLKKSLMITTAFIYYMAVRAFGWLFWNYD